MSPSASVPKRKAVGFVKSTSSRVMLCLPGVVAMSCTPFSLSDVRQAVVLWVG